MPWKDKTVEELRQEFAEAARKLSRVWLENEEYDPICKQMEAYILRGGVYGNTKNRILVQQQKEGGRIKYALSRIFLPHEIIKFQYPILQKHRWLTPVMQVYRWCNLLLRGHLRRTAEELQYNLSVSETERANTQRFLEQIGLYSFKE